jgi:mannose-1-phosphate guanylyltransferase
MEAAGSNLWGLVLAGGDGTRLQPLTRALTGAPIPKQYCRIAGGRSLLEATIARIRPLIPRARTLVVVNHDHLEVASEQLGGLPPENVLVQPANRDTGPGLLFSLLHLVPRHRAATVVVFPSDHHVRDAGAFVARVEQLVQVVARLPDRIALLGVRPDGVESDLGYIEPGGPVPLGETGTALEVEAFHEKPDHHEAARIIAGGGLWNTFVMAFHRDRGLHLVRNTRPADYAHMKGLLDHPETLAAAYRSLPSWNFSRDLLARVPHHLVAVPSGDIGWSDWGTPDAVARTLARVADPPSWPTAETAAVRYATSGAIASSSSPRVSGSHR